ncbi:hypothetical protein BC830DRAFT_1092352 [Chytriomyces sp. MP71]|nr:hypothetical protein BC830DRAFT_1092352 [Chytriomyces sp. MP71]
MAASGVSSIEIRLEADIFAEVAKLISPIAESYVKEMKIEDQHVKKTLPLLGEKEVAKATNIKIEKFEIKDVVMPLNDGFVGVNIDDVEFKVSMDMTALGGHIGIVKIEAMIDILAKVKFGLIGKKIKTDVFDCKVALRNFDTHIGTGITGDILAHVTDLLEFVLKSEIESSLQSTVESSLDQSLDSILARNWDITGNVSKVFYNMNVAFLETPTITKAEGMKMVIGIDAYSALGAPPVIAKAEDAALADLKIEE